MRTATVTAAVARGGSLIIRATCSTCGRPVLHGVPLDALADVAARKLTMLAACGCRDYVLTDPDGIAAEAAAAAEAAPTVGAVGAPDDDHAAATIIDRLAHGPRTQLTLAKHAEAYAKLGELVARGDIVASVHRGRTVYRLAN